VKTIAFVLAAALASLAAAEASASEEYPAAIKGDLDLDYTPRCDLCHEHAEAPVGDASQPFARSLEARGLVGGDDVASLKRALVRDKGVDSDGDGAEDLDELSWGGNPNVSDAPKGKPPPEVSYGCGGGPQGTAAIGAFTALIGLAFSGRRRRRRR
jgi:MYXO-CTERM domain-containing protein